MLRLKTGKTLIRHGKDSNKNRETHSFWKHIFNYGTIYPYAFLYDRYRLVQEASIMATKIVKSYYHS